MHLAHSLGDSREQQHLFDSGEGHLTTSQYGIMVGTHMEGRDCMARQEAREIQGLSNISPLGRVHNPVTIWSHLERILTPSEGGTYLDLGTWPPSPTS